MDPTSEQALRARLGIPPDAAQVMVFAESSHWDPDWLCTWDEYFDRYVRNNLDIALDELSRDPRRVYSIECLFFLQAYWEARPERQEVVRGLVNSGRLRLTSTGVTTPDTLVAPTEAILRDWLVGQEWLRRNGMTVEPTLAYFPDSFGCSHSLPSLLNAAGFTKTAITRLDGMLFMGCDWPFPWRFQWEGSSAWRLMRHERSLDFIWRDNNGGEVLAHWNAFTYGQGDMLAFSGLTRVYLYRLATPNRSERNVARRIHQYARQLRPCSRTPYLFCPIGFDFVEPIPDLVPLLDRYNRRHYPETGLWVVNAGLDDYLALVGCHREKLPVLELDPNPYWTGFYASRPSLKALAHSAVDRLRLAEGLALQPENAAALPAAAPELARLWADLVVSNHHDFITGTSPDRVVETEQRPWLRRVNDQARALANRLASARTSAPGAAARADLPEWRQGGGTVEIRTPSYAVVLAEEAGGCIVRLWDPASGEPLLTGPSNDLVCYADSGGLWRMGMEFLGGTFREIGRASDRPARLVVTSGAGVVEVASTVELDGQSFIRRLWFRSDTARIRAQTQGRAAEKRTVTARFTTRMDASPIVMDEPGGVSRRPAERKYVPTFWPAESFAHIGGAGGGRGVALLLAMPGAVACRPGGLLELVTHRNATHETAFGLIHFPGQPATGHERDEHSADYAILFTASGDWRENRLLERVQSSFAAGAEHAALAASLVEIDPPGVVVAAVKPAWRGPGMIVRLVAPEASGRTVTLCSPRGRVREAWLCDARERDLRALEIADGRVAFPMAGAIASLRLIVESVL